MKSKFQTCLLAMVPLLSMLCLACSEDSSGNGGICFDDMNAVSWRDVGENAFYDFDRYAPDMQMEDIDRGQVSLKEVWNGCDTYIFLIYFAEDMGWSNVAFSAAKGPLITNAPENLKYIVMSTEATPDQRETRVQNIGDELLSAAGTDKKTWEKRIYLIKDSPHDVSGLKEILAGYNGAFPQVISSLAIDRTQKIREISSATDFGMQGFFPSISMAVYSGPYFNWRHQLETRIAEEDASSNVLKVNLFDGDVVWASSWYRDFYGQSLYFPLELPSKEELQEYNHLEVDITADCSGRMNAGYTHPNVGQCEPWDAIANLFLCNGGDGFDCEDQIELVRWITPYHHEGRWVVDITPVLPLLKDGGRKWIGLIGPDYLFDVDFRFSTVEGELMPVQTLPQIQWHHDSVDVGMSTEFELPGDYKKVTAYLVPSGHGEAEFSTWTTHLRVNTTNYSQQFVTEQAYRCALRTNEGVVPNQAGTWFFNRSNWCPGFPVDTWHVDITDSVGSGTNSFEYSIAKTGGNVNVEAMVVVWN